MDRDKRMPALFHWNRDHGLIFTGKISHTIPPTIKKKDIKERCKRGERIRGIRVIIVSMCVLSFRLLFFIICEVSGDKRYEKIRRGITVTSQINRDLLIRES